jgi:hypothetical protein
MPFAAFIVEPEPECPALLKIISVSIVKSGRANSYQV